MAMIPPKPNAGAFELCPAGPQQLVCCDVINHGWVKSAYAGKDRLQPKISIRWQSIKKMKDGRPFLVQKRYTFSMHEKATLRKDVNSWRGVALTDEEAAVFDVEKLIGVNCFANVVHERKTRGVFAEVVSLMPLPDEMADIIVRDYVRLTERGEGETHSDPGVENPKPGEAMEPPPTVGELDFPTDAPPRRPRF